MKPILVVLAAGMGSRYGSLKQMDRLGPQGESIIDFSVFDAARAGFGKVIFVLREEIVDDFYLLFANRYRSDIEVDHVVQRLSDVPPGVRINPERSKPWGTGHAMLSAADKLNAPFAVINGDDYYGSDAFRVMHDFLNSADPDDLNTQSMVGYILNRTLSDHGSVSRGICDTDSDGYLTGVAERTHIAEKNGQIYFLDEKGIQHPLTGREVVSMNFWGFTPAILPAFRDLFMDFISSRGMELKSEFYIPYGVNLLVEKYKTRVKVLESQAKWFGVTYQEDKPVVKDNLARLFSEGQYPVDMFHES